MQRSLTDACRSRDLHASLKPFIVATCEATLVMPTATLDRVSFMPHSHAAACILCARRVCMSGGNIVEPRRRTAAGGCSASCSVHLGHELQLRAAGSGVHVAWRTTAWCHRGCGCCCPAARRPCCSASVAACRSARSPVAHSGRWLSYWVDWAGWGATRGAWGAV